MTEAVPDAGSEEFDRLLEQNALATFIDAHNTSYYVNSYTTKVNPTMDGVLCKLLDGVRRLRDEWEDSEAQRQERARNGPPSEQEKQPRAIADARRRESFRRTMQVLCRFETCFRRASWKSGSEMVFPMLFGHLAFMTHRCWKVFMRRAIYLAAEAWRRAYGQLETVARPPDSFVAYTLPANGEVVLMTGWSREKRGDIDVYTSPDGEEYDCIEYAYKAFEDAKARSGNFGFLARTLNHIKEGCSEEAPAPGAASLNDRAPRGAVLSQHDDWMHRGDHPIVRDMSLYIYSIWIYRVELRPSACGGEDEGSGGPTSPHIDISFESSYAGGRNWTQRLAMEPRIPKVEGF